MKKVTVFSIFTLAILLTACESKSKKASQKPEAQPEQMVGNDKDSHGCIGSAGYTWSALKNECIRLFEAGIRLDPQVAIADKTVSAFVVFKAMGDDKKAEVYLPGEAAPRMFAKQANNMYGDKGTWKGGELTLRLTSAGKYLFEDAKGTALYQSQ